MSINCKVDASLSACNILGGGWALVFSNGILLKCRTNDDRYSSAGVGGLCVGIFSSFARLAFVWRLCVPCKCAKNSVGCGGQSLGILYVYEMLK